MTIQTAIFAAGCFWGVEAEFRALDGVVGTTVGYTGGSAQDPTYRRVCQGVTGHAEAVLVEFDRGAISYEELLAVFWSCHNPTLPHRRGWDPSNQYRSAIFVADDAQRGAAIASRDELQRDLEHEIVTQIQPAERFWPAEDYHQQYLEKRGQASCATTIGAGVRDAAPIG